MDFWSYSNLEMVLVLKRGDEVIIPAYTYSATALAVLHCGATPVMVDVKDDFTVNLMKLKRPLLLKQK